MTIKQLVDEIEKRTSLYYEDEDADGNLVPKGLNTLKELIGSLKHLKKAHEEQIKLLRRKIKQEILSGNILIINRARLEDKEFVGDLYVLGKDIIISRCLFFK